MSTQTEMKKQLLLDSFEALLKEYKTNDNAMRELISKMSRLDMVLTSQLWEKLILSNKNLFPAKGGSPVDCWGITERIIYEIKEDGGGIEAAALIIRNSDILMNYIYNKSSYLGKNSGEVIGALINMDDFESANKILKLAVSNKSDPDNSDEFLVNFDLFIGDVIIGAIDQIKENGSLENRDKAIELIQYYINEIVDKTEKAKASVRFIDLLE
ncbi:MAG: hypothetical protein GX933_06945 [Chloroflexi bacterium]|nr:hypothetical protein [Chloroflexota bacterium]